MEKPVSFRSDGKTLKGIVHIPERSWTGRGVVFLNAGLKPRVGPHRIYVKIARRLCEEGFPSLRFDLAGVGDSEGEIVDPHYDCFEPSQVSDAIGFFTQEAAVPEVTLLGMCAGSRIALRAAVGDSRVTSVVLVSFPMTFAYANSPTGRHFSRTVGREGRSSVAHRFYLAHFLRRSRDLGAWRRLLSNGADTKAIVKLALASLWARLRGLGRRVAGQTVDSWRSFLSSGRKMLVVYAQHDEPLIWDFKDHVHLAPHSADEPAYDLRIIEGACHAFPECGAQERLVDEISAWLKDSRSRSRNAAS